MIINNYFTGKLREFYLKVVVYTGLLCTRLCTTQFYRLLSFKMKMRKFFLRKLCSTSVFFIQLSQEITSLVTVTKPPSVGGIINRQCLSKGGKRNWAFALNSNVHITPMSLQPNSVNLSYFNLRLFDLTETRVWNI